MLSHERGACYIWLPSVDCGCWHFQDQKHVEFGANTKSILFEYVLICLNFGMHICQSFRSGPAGFIGRLLAWVRPFASSAAPGPASWSGSMSVAPPSLSALDRSASSRSARWVGATNKLACVNFLGRNEFSQNKRSEQLAKFLMVSFQNKSDRNPLFMGGGAHDPSRRGPRGDSRRRKAWKDALGCERSNTQKRPSALGAAGVVRLPRGSGPGRSAAGLAVRSLAGTGTGGSEGNAAAETVIDLPPGTPPH